MKTDVPPRFCLICLVSLALMLLGMVPSAADSTDYAAEFSEQIHRRLEPPFTINQTATFDLKYKNTADPHSIDLRSVDGATSSNQVDNHLYPDNGPNVFPWVAYHAQVLVALVNFPAAIKFQCEIDLSWTDDILGETGFKFYRKISSERVWSEMANLTAQIGSYTACKGTHLVFNSTSFYGLIAYSASTHEIPHFSTFATVSATTENLSQYPNCISVYRLVRAIYGHLCAISLEEKKTVENACYVFDGEDRNGTISCLFDKKGTLNKIIDTIGWAFSLSYDAVDHLTKLTDPTGRSMKFSTSANANLTSSNDPTGAITGDNYGDWHLMTIVDQRSVIAAHIVYNAVSRVV